MANKIGIHVPRKRIAEFCRKWDIKEFSLFGSVLSDNFGPDSDIDVLVSFNEGATHTLFDLVRMGKRVGGGIWACSGCGEPQGY